MRLVKLSLNSFKEACGILDNRLLENDALLLGEVKAF